ncbi:MAG: PaaI family thioesterase [Alphaproteobacteria bacterium]|nr:PaaI family thioesterase [Alphaproteobacteria bacterium]MCD8519741.1 PaaI family thioesterase [Alphaproteobacteria bacterium]MCD8525787.1 PaaI family thioesterase [Alphaproteobacteria bacterium]
MIWRKAYTIPEIHAFITADNILDHLGLEFIEVGPDFVKARLPVDKRTHQIHGILHGGATCVLAETVGSFASLMCIDLEKEYAVGSVITANHLRPATEGFVTATCKPVHIGRSKHVWDIAVHNDAGKLIAKCELTCAVTPKL